MQHNYFSFKLYCYYDVDSNEYQYGWISGQINQLGVILTCSILSSSTGYSCEKFETNFYKKIKANKDLNGYVDRQHLSQKITGYNLLDLLPEYEDKINIIIQKIKQDSSITHTETPEKFQEFFENEILQSTFMWGSVQEIDGKFYRFERKPTAVFENNTLGVEIEYNNDLRQWHRVRLLRKKDI